MLQDDQALLLDMLIAARQVRAYVEGVNWAAFHGNRMLQDAVSHQLQIIGEAANRVSPNFRDGHGEIPWHRIIGMRHRLVHDYRGIRRDRLWDAAENWIPLLVESLEPLVPPPPEE